MRIILWKPSFAASRLSCAYHRATVEAWPCIRLHRTLLIPSQFYSIRRQIADDLLYCQTFAKRKFVNALYD